MHKLPFCYLCGKNFGPKEKTTRDHLPPSALFRREDRDIPLVLPTHEACNAREHADDELLGLLIATIQGWPLPTKHRYMQGDVIGGGPGLRTLSKQLNLPRFIIRCVRGFHTALYGEWLPPDTHNALHPPMRCGLIDPSTGSATDPVQAGNLVDGLLEQHALFVSVIKKNRLAGRTDKVVSRNGKCVYECVWAKSDDGLFACIFGLKIYDWHRFGELAGYTPRGCVGVYRPRTGRPATGTTETDLEFPFPNRDELNPFGD